MSWQVGRLLEKLDSDVNNVRTGANWQLRVHGSFSRTEVALFVVLPVGYHQNFLPFRIQCWWSDAKSQMEREATTSCYHVFVFVFVLAFVFVFVFSFLFVFVLCFSDARSQMKREATTSGFVAIHWCLSLSCMESTPLDNKMLVIG